MSGLRISVVSPRFRLCGSDSRQRSPSCVPGSDLENEKEPRIASLAGVSAISLGDPDRAWGFLHNAPKRYSAVNNWGKSEKKGTERKREKGDGTEARKRGRREKGDGTGEKKGTERI